MTPALRLVTFRRGDAVFGVDVENVRKVLRAPPQRPLAASPAFVAGAITVDGGLEVLVDLAVLFGAEVPEKTPDRAVLVTLDGRHFAFLADEAGEVADVTEASVQSLPPFVGGARRSSLRGVVVRDRDEVLVLDLSNLLHASEMEALEMAGSAAPEGGSA